MLARLLDGGAYWRFPGILFSLLFLPVALQASTLPASIKTPAGVVAEVVLNPNDRAVSPTDARAFDQFGASVSISGDRALVGTFKGELASNFQPGKAYVFHKVGAAWQMEAMLTANDGVDEDSFGWASAIEGDIAAVCASGHRDDLAGLRGAAYIFERQADGHWLQVAKFMRPPTTHAHLYCAAVTVSNGRVFVGSRSHPAAGMEAFGSVYVYENSNETWQLASEIMAPSGQTNDYFGADLAADEDVVAISANGRRNSGGQRTGSVLVYRRVGTDWLFEQELWAPDGVTNDIFGASVRLSGRTIVVGAPNATRNGMTRAGAVHVFEFGNGQWSHAAGFIGNAAFVDFGDEVALHGNHILAYQVGGGGGKLVRITSIDGTWVRAGELLAADSVDETGWSDSSSDAFGYHLAFDGEHLMASATASNSSNPDLSGAVFLYRVNDGIPGPATKLRAGDAAKGDRFGNEMAGNDSTLLVGALLDDTIRGRDSGSVQIFRREPMGWVADALLIPDDGTGFERFGSSMAIDQDIVVVGAPQATTMWGVGAGAAYVFERQSGVWRQIAKLLPPSGAHQDRFGYAVAVSGDRIAVSVPNEDPIQTGEFGTIHVYQRSGSAWVHTQSILPPIADQSIRFGRSLAMSADTLVVSADINPASTPMNSAAGIVYRWSGSQWNWEATLQASAPRELDSVTGGVALVGDEVFVSYPSSGVALQFRRNGSTWVRAATLAPAEPVANWGYSISADAEHVLFGTGTTCLVFERRTGHWRTLGEVNDPWGYIKAAAIAGGQLNCGFQSANSQVTGLTFVGQVTSTPMAPIHADGFE